MPGRAEPTGSDHGAPYSESDPGGSSARFLASGSSDHGGVLPCSDSVGQGVQVEGAAGGAAGELEASRMFSAQGNTTTAAVARKMVKTGMDDCNVSVDMSTDDTSSCGWCGIRPAFLKPCSNITGYLAVVSLTGLLHYLIPFGLIFAVLTTLEKRFHLSSTESGSIASAYQFSAMFFTVFIGYIAEKGHKPVWVGIGSLVLAAGAVVFSLPHFLAEPYYVTPLNQSEVNDSVCPSVYSGQIDRCGTDNPTREDAEDGVRSYYWLFILAQIMLGFAGAPVFTLGVTYLDENLKPKNFGLYLGIYNAFLNAGPALGFFIGAMSLSVFTDLSIDKDGLLITPDNPLWIGAWWLGFLVAAVVVTILAVIIMGFPKTQPGNKKLANTRRSETQKGSEYNKRSGFRKNLLDFPRAVCKIISNPPFMGICFAMASEWFVIAGMAVFIPKFLEAQFNMSSSEVARIIGVMSITAQLSGALGSGLIINRLDLRFKGLLKLCLVCVSISILAALAFTMHCPMVPFSGVTHGKSVKSMYSQGEDMFSLPCNSHCVCSSKPFEPVCGSDGVMYYSPCHAGCTEEASEDSPWVYQNCQCSMEDYTVHVYSSKEGMVTVSSDNKSSYGAYMYQDSSLHTPSLEDGTALPGRCFTSCPYKWPYIIMLWVFFFVNTFAIVPAWAGSIRCVSYSQRSFALGVQTVIYGLGSAPSSIVFGLFIDKACVVWEALCGITQICWLYDNHMFAYTLLGLTLVCKLLSILFFGGAHFLYKPILNKEDDGEKDDKEEDV
ncbi:solute carrier organic anion transporter family member 4A1-like [Diadema setosum]|uniref:solute carrier organic anion transporter family member 4A1-like n=1 Tax=Diadema setosum TaxID=31175 RepID=UPI003B3BBBEA